jgi:hypothetical protein
MDRLLSLDAAAQAMGQPIARLRHWCATGRLRCEREGGDWLIPLAELPHITALVEDHERAVEAGKSAVLVVPVSAATADLPAEIARRLGLPVGTVSTSTLALDGSEYLLAVWKTDGTVALGPVAELAAELGGDLLDGEAKAG